MTSPDRIINLVEAHRDHMGAARKFPDGADCTIFAIGEGGGELFDAWMRLDSSFQRNNAKDIDPSKEAADLMYMIGSAIVAIRRGNVGEVEIREEMLAEIVDRLCAGLLSLARHQPGAALNNLEYALKHTLDLCARERWNPAELLSAKIARDNARYLPTPAIVQNGSLNHAHDNHTDDHAVDPRRIGG